jgi:hypothetical protein
MALLIAAALLAAMHVREGRGNPVKPVASWMVALVGIVVAVATMVQVYRIGDSGARATWDDRVPTADAGTPK